MQEFEKPVKTTIVYQSFRTDNVPDWIHICMDSVKHWSEINGFDYLFVGDELFEYSPDWYRQRVQNQIHLVSDLSRVVLAKELFSKGYDRAIWIDADVLVFSPQDFQLPKQEGYAFCRELWLHPVSNNQLGYTQKVNNSVMLLSKETSLTEFYIHACHEIVKQDRNLSHTSVGTKFLTVLNSQFPIDKIKAVGLFSPILTQAIVSDFTGVVRSYMNRFKYNMYAANLCLSFLDREFLGITLSDRSFMTVISKLMETNGNYLNQYHSQAI
ncbi:MAG: hypothetical protein AB4050_13885 [Synechococcus sp.]